MKSDWYVEKFNWEKMRDAYPKLDIEYLKTGCGELSCFLEELRASGIKQLDPLYLICDSCGKEYSLKKDRFRSRVLRFINEEEKCYFTDFQTCQNSECKRKKLALINEYRKEIGDSPATGHKVTEEQKEKWRKTAKKNGKVNKIWEWRKGKTLVEMYGEEKGNILKEKLLQARLNQEVDPRLGKKHSEESKALMSKSRKKFLDNNSDWYKESPLTGELVDFKTYSSHAHIHVWEKLSREEREERCKKQSTSFLKNFSDKDRHSLRGYHRAWWQKDLDKDQAFMSSYEVKYYTLLDKEKIYYKNNTQILIPYLHPIVKEMRYYSPDVIIYKDDSFSEITGIVEVKPYEFAVNPDDRTTDYYRITAAKINALKEYCKENNYNCKVVTEEDLGYDNSNHIVLWFRGEYNV